MDSDLDFFIIIDDRFTNRRRLQLPPGCRQRMQALSDHIVLRDRYKNVWPVKITKKGAKWYFEEGWTMLYIDNSLEPLDSLLFTYNGDNLFDFNLLGSNGCQKDGVGGRALLAEEEEIDYEGEEDVEGSSEDREVEYVKEEEEERFEDREVESVGGNGEEEKDMDSRSERDVSSDVSYVQGETDDSNEEYVKEGREDEEEQRENVARKPDKFNSRSNVHGAAGSVTEFGVGTIPRKRSYKKRSVPDCYGADIFRLGLIPRPNNPYFVSRSRSVRKPNELYIPSEVIIDYNISIPANFALVDEKGGKWGAKIRQWGDGRLACIQGWDSLCKANHIQRDEVCICEFVQGEDQKDFCIKVQHLRK